MTPAARWSPAIVVLAALLVAGGRPGSSDRAGGLLPAPAAAQRAEPRERLGQTDCEERYIGNGLLLHRAHLDSDQDGITEIVVLYRDDSKIYILELDTSSPGHCRAVFEEELDLVPAFQTVTVKSVELIEVTGDELPDLHVALDANGGGPRVSYALHAVYVRSGHGWQRATRFGLCLPYHAFAFLPRPDGLGKDLYLEQDRQCQPPIPVGRQYAILRWNGSAFVTILSGEHSPLAWIAGLLALLAGGWLLISRRSAGPRARRSTPR